DRRATLAISSHALALARTFFLAISRLCALARAQGAHHLEQGFPGVFRRILEHRLVKAGKDLADARSGADAEFSHDIVAIDRKPADRQGFAPSVDLLHLLLDAIEIGDLPLPAAGPSVGAAKVQKIDQPFLVPRQHPAPERLRSEE